MFVTDGAATPPTRSWSDRSPSTPSRSITAFSSKPTAPARIDAFTATTGNTITFNAVRYWRDRTFLLYLQGLQLDNLRDTKLHGDGDDQLFVFTTNTHLVGSTLDANVFVTDAAGSTANSALTGVFTVGALPTIALATNPAPSGIDAFTTTTGNTITFNAYVTGGTGPFSYTFKVYNSVTKATINSMGAGASNCVRVHR